MDKLILRSSRYCHWFQKSDTTALFHSLYVKTLFLDNNEHARLLSLITSRSSFNSHELTVAEQAVAERLYELGVLISQDEDEGSLVDELKDKYTGFPDIQIMYLILTETCNLACKYCFIENAMPVNRSLKNMTVTTAKKAVDLFSRSLCKTQEIKPSIIFYGGEPTINWSVLVEAVEYIKSKIAAGDLPDTTEISMISNGTLLTEERINFIKYNNIGLSLSIDGVGSNNDARVFVDGRPSIDRVLQTYELTKKIGYPVGISCTVTPTNVDHLDEITSWMIEEQVASVGFNILMDTPNRPQITPELVTKISNCLTNAYVRLRNHNIYEDRIGRKVNTFINQEIYPFDCAGYGGQLVIAPDGAIGVCHAYLGEREYFVANVNTCADFNPQDNQVFLEWSSRSPFNMSQCQDCPVLGICGGGCAKNAEMKHGSIWGLDDRFCIHAKHTLEWMLWDLFDISLYQSEEITNE